MKPMILGELKKENDSDNHYGFHTYDQTIINKGFVVIAWIPKYRFRFFREVYLGNIYKSRNILVWSTGS